MPEKNDAMPDHQLMSDHHRTAADIQKLVPSDNLKALRQRSDQTGLAFLIGHGLTLLVTGWLMAFTLETAWVLPAMFVHGVVIVHLFAPFHETTHGLSLIHI